MSTAIHIDDLWKEYRLGVIGHGTLMADLQSWWAQVRGKEDPNSLILRIKKQEKQIEGDRFWALRGIDLEVKQGEILGIIGMNGAGKSTLLKILSRVTAPTQGSIKVRGRIASLLEVGTGFHPELTGKENIFLNGAILGMSPREIKSKIDEIVNFAELKDFIDTPVKRYSSGMYVRLAFAVAAHLDPEIMIVDEVLAVGDIRFQKKCLGKMSDVVKDGRTVLFVSHNMATMKKICNNAIVLKNGEIVFRGTASDAVNDYMREQSSNLKPFKRWEEGSEPGDDSVKLTYFKIFGDDLLNPKSDFKQNEYITIETGLRLESDTHGFRVNFSFETMTSEIAFIASSQKITMKDFRNGEYRLSVVVPKDILNYTKYIVYINIDVPNKKVIVNHMQLANISIEEVEQDNELLIEKWPGAVAPKLEWKIGEL